MAGYAGLHYCSTVHPYLCHLLEPVLTASVYMYAEKSYDMH